MDITVTNEMIISAFRHKGLRATPQRISVYRFLLLNPIHPSADEIYNEVIREYPNFSKTTIYNTLSALVDSGLAITVKINENELRYDGNPEFHGHFKCSECGRIFDFRPKLAEYQGLDEFLVRQRDVYFSGVCKNCLSKTKCL